MQSDMFKMRPFSIVVLLILFSGMSICAKDNAKDILAKVDTYRGYNQPFQMNVEVIDYNKNGKEGNKLSFLAHIKDRQSSFLKYIYPPIDKGKVLLMVGNNVWFYHKKISKPLRLSQRQRLLGNVSNADVARANFSFDYTPEIQGKKKIKKQNTLVLELKAKHKKVAYSKIILYLNPDTYQPIQGEFYAFSGKLLKTSTYTQFHKVSDSLKIKQMEIVDAVLKGSKTTITYSEYELKSLPDHYFNPDFLPRIQRF